MLDDADLSSLGCPLLVVQQQLQEDGSYSVSRSVAFSIAWLPRNPADSTFQEDLDTFGSNLRHCRAASTKQLVGGNMVQAMRTQAAAQWTPGAKRSNQRPVIHKTATHCGLVYPAQPSSWEKIVVIRAMTHSRSRMNTLSTATE